MKPKNVSDQVSAPLPTVIVSGARVNQEGGGSSALRSVEGIDDSLSIRSTAEMGGAGGAGAASAPGETGGSTGVASICWLPYASVRMAMTAAPAAAAMND